MCTSSWRLALTQNLGFDAFYKVVGLGVLANHPVLSQMAAGSGYLTQLNSSANLAREAGAIPARVGLVYELDRYWQAGLIRLFDPRAADVWYSRIWGSIATLEFAGSYLMVNYPTNSMALTIANRLYSAASLLRTFDPAWCWAVTLDSSCRTPHDGIVPMWSQTYPAAQNLYVHGPSHLQEAQASDSVDLVRAVHLHAGRAPRRGAAVGVAECRRRRRWRLRRAAARRIASPG